jgi:hypothetical protein
MDPYLEDPTFWPGFHTTLLTAIRAAITPHLPPGFYADVEQHVWFREEEPGEPSPRVKPDVYVLEGAASAVKTKSKPKVRTATTPPTHRATLPNIVREVGPHTVRIRDARNRRVVTAIELLSPSNKSSGPDRDRYILKRNEFVANGTNMVEIDLLRAGERLPYGVLPDGDYYVYLTREAYYNEVIVWVFTVRDPMPVFPIPLTTDHPDIPLDLRPCFDRAYTEANYGPQINYVIPPVPALRPTDAAWATELLRKPAKKGKR